jgi:acyl carrier protein
MKDRIKKVLKHSLKLENVKDNISRNNCNKWDSLAHLNLVVDIEIEFNISLEPEEIIKMNSLYQIEEIIQSKLN